MADDSTPGANGDNKQTITKPMSLESVSEDDRNKAEQLKEKANEYFKREVYDDAISHYTQAIELNPFSAPYYGNRSFAYLRTECFGYALEDASKALQIDPKYLKAYYRRASANMALGKFKLALKDFETNLGFSADNLCKQNVGPDQVTKVRPNDKDAKAKYTECNKIVTMNAFARAIAVDDNKSIADSLDFNTMAIEDDYEGPQLDNGKVTEDFVKQLMDTFRDQKKLHRKYAYQILVDVRNMFKDTPSLVDITIPEGEKFTVCGDIHGQYYDLLNIFKLNGPPSESNPYLFNGDFVDRGSFSVECILTIFTFKLLYPNHFFLARGNHESFTMNQMYGFEGEVKSKYTGKMAELFTEVFNWLPLAHCINNKILVMHGGLFKDDNVVLDDLRKIDRNRQPPEEGLMCELLWSDPQPQCGRSQSKRGVGTQFGPDVTKRFLQKNKLDYVIRSHEVKNEGYEIAHDGKCITVFSAPNYCVDSDEMPHYAAFHMGPHCFDTMGNKGAFITLKGDDLTPKFTTYEAVPHPNVKPMQFASSLFGLF